jgi:hypothetical protein
MSPRSSAEGRGSRITQRLHRSADFSPARIVVRTIDAPSRGLALGPGSARLSIIHASSTAATKSFREIAGSFGSLAPPKSGPTNPHFYALRGSVLFVTSSF